MIPDIERTNIVIVGRWNRFILNPEWVSKTLFETDKMQVEFSFDLLLPPRYSNDSIRLTALDDRVIITPLEYTDDRLQTAELISLRLINLLPHTPLTGIGFNYGYQCDGSLINQIIEFKDTLDTEVDTSMSFISWKRSYKIDDYLLNVEQSQSDDKIIIDFNYHFNSAYFKNNIDIVKGKMLELKNRTELIMRNTYGEERNDSE